MSTWVQNNPTKSPVQTKLEIVGVQRRRISFAGSLERADANWKRCGAKVRALGFFSRQLTDKEARRGVLNGFMEQMKDQKRADKAELAEQIVEYDQAADRKTAIKTIRPKTPTGGRKWSAPEGPTWKKYEVKPGSKCALCSCIFPAFRENEALPCRICDDVFHRDCLEGCGDLTTADKCNIDLAKTNIGWSCPKCANIALLLTTDEIHVMTEKFDQLDFNKDAQVSVEEYLRHHSRRRSMVDVQGRLLPQEEELLLKEYERLDQDGDGFMDWWEFVNQESKLYLVNMDKYDLANLLSQKELMAAKAVFKRLDKDNDGKVKQYEAKDAYAKWYKRFETNRHTQGSNVPIDSNTLDLHVTIAAQCIMDADSTGQGEVEWKDFILDQAIYIICCRPNYRTRRR